MTQNLEAGRELDALVAERVMKVDFVSKTVGEDPWAREILMLTGAGCTCGMCQKMGNQDMVHGPLMHGMVYPEVRPYSTDIAAAWEVVEKLHQNCDSDSWCFVLEDVGQKTDALSGSYWSAEFFGDYAATEPTVPLAICLAALKAVE